jgi:hypothetical protein
MGKAESGSVGIYHRRFVVETDEANLPVEDLSRGRIIVQKNGLMLLISIPTKIIWQMKDQGPLFSIRTQIFPSHLRGIWIKISFWNRWVAENYLLNTISTTVQALVNQAKDTCFSTNIFNIQHIHIIHDHSKFSDTVVQSVERGQPLSVCLNEEGDSPLNCSMTEEGLENRSKSTGGLLKADSPRTSLWAGVYSSL